VSSKDAPAATAGLPNSTHTGSRSRAGRSAPAQPSERFHRRQTARTGGRIQSGETSATTQAQPSRGRRVDRRGLLLRLDQVAKQQPVVYGRNGDRPEVSDFIAVVPERGHHSFPGFTTTVTRLPRGNTRSRHTQATVIVAGNVGIGTYAKNTNAYGGWPEAIWDDNGVGGYDGYRYWYAHRDNTWISDWMSGTAYLSGGTVAGVGLVQTWQYET
jgi:hypothetical protein